MLLEPTKYLMSVMQIKPKGGWMHELEAQEVNVTRRSKVSPYPVGSREAMCRNGVSENRGGDRKQRMTFKKGEAHEISWEGPMRG